MNTGIYHVHLIEKVQYYLCHLLDIVVLFTAIHSLGSSFGGHFTAALNDSKTFIYMECLTVSLHCQVIWQGYVIRIIWIPWQNLIQQYLIVCRLIALK